MKIGILGTGAWGTALANVLTDNGHTVVMYGIVDTEVNDINNNSLNSKYFPGFRLSNISATKNIAEAVENKDVIILAVPSDYITDTVTKINQYLNSNPVIINAAKGFDPKTNMTFLPSIREKIDNDKVRGVASILGPSFANDVIDRQITLVCAVSKNTSIAKFVQKLFSNHYFRVYTNTDEIGCEIGAALKNIIAMASGIVAGLGFSDNTRAAIITRGLAEIANVGVSLGAKYKTFIGLTGVGDLLLTASSIKSRNYSAGYQIGQDNSPVRFLEENTKTVEGIKGCLYLINIAKQKELHVPITQGIYNIIFNGSNPRHELISLLSRELKDE
jgi:glycerol-3-phosphate dehydrogenase (NAD(P)+)